MRILLALIPALLAAQPGVTVDQLKRGNATDLTKLRLFAIEGNQLVGVSIGAGLKLELVNGTPTITAETFPARVTVDQPLPEIVERVLTRDPNGNYGCAQCKRVYRNGIRQTKDVNYRFNGVLILPMQPWAADDTITGEWLEKPAPVPVASNPRAIPCSEVWRAPGCCTDASQSLDCPQFYHLLPDRFKPLIESGVTIGQIEQASVAANGLVKFSQIKNWAQLRNPQSRGIGISLDQTPMPRDIAEMWQSHAASPQHDEYRVALVKTQDFPILITCTDGRCDDSWPLWFRAADAKPSGLPSSPIQARR